MFYSALDFNDHALWDVPHRLEVNKNPLTKRMHNTMYVSFFILHIFSLKSLSSK